MRLRQLEYFVRVCELGSITRAANACNVAQPALGLRIRDLEEELGAVLLTRTSRGVAPTPEGQLVLEWAQNMLHETKKLREKIRVSTGDENQTIAVGLTPSLITSVAADLIEGCRERLPNARLRIVEGLSQSIWEWVEAERIDIGLAYSIFESQAVQYRPLLRERLFYLCKADGDTGPITLADVLRRPLAMPEQFNSIRNAVDAAAQSIGFPVLGSFEISSFQAAKEISMRGIAGAIGPFGCMAPELEACGIAVRPIIEPTVERTLYLLKRVNHTPSKAATALTQILLDLLANVVERTKDKKIFVAETISLGAS